MLQAEKIPVAKASELAQNNLRNLRSVLVAIFFPLRTALAWRSPVGMPPSSLFSGTQALGSQLFPYTRMGSPPLLYLLGPSGSRVTTTHLFSQEIKLTTTPCTRRRLAATPEHRCSPSPSRQSSSSGGLQYSTKGLPGTEVPSSPAFQRDVPHTGAGLSISAQFEFNTAGLALCWHRLLLRPPPASAHLLY